MSEIQKPGANRARMRQVIISAFFIYQSTDANATQNFDDNWRRADDVFSGNVFGSNPAGLKTNQTTVRYRRLSIESNKKAELVDNDLVIDREYKEASTEHHVGLLNSLGGGAAVAISGKMFGSDDEYRSSDRTDEPEETFRSKMGRASFVADLTPALKFGFSYQVTETRADLRGNFNIDRDDRTAYLASNSGYIAGLSYRSNDYAFGLVYMPPLKGKAEIEGEQKIFIEAGMAGFDFAYSPAGRYVASVAFEKYFHKTDERSLRGTSPDDQRTISLRGMDLEQFLHPLERRSIGIEFTVYPNALLYLGLNQTSALALSAENETAIKDHENGEAVNYQGAVANLNFSSDPFVLSIGVAMKYFKISEFNDQTNWFGGRNYEDFSGEQRQILIGLGYLSSGP